MSKKTSNIEFDSESDHLYLKIQEPRSSDGEELGESGIFLFYGEDEEIVSLEIVGVSTHDVESISLLKPLLPKAAYDELREFFAQEALRKMKYFFDTEFVDRGLIDLISIGIVCEDGREYYACNKECDLTLASPWVKENVIPLLPPRYEWKTRFDIKHELLEFFGDLNIELWADHGAHDFVAFGQLMSCTVESAYNPMSGYYPENLPWSYNELRQLERFSFGDLSTLPKIGEHDALQDARWNKLAYEHLRRKLEQSIGD